MTQPLSLALLSFVPVALLAVLFPHLLASLITAAVIAEIGFLIPVSNRLVRLKRELGDPVPFRERHPLLLSLLGVGQLRYAPHHADARRRLRFHVPHDLG